MTVMYTSPPCASPWTWLPSSPSPPGTTLMLKELRPVDWLPTHPFIMSWFLSPCLLLWVNVFSSPTPGKLEREREMQYSLIKLNRRLCAMELNNGKIILWRPKIQLDYVTMASLQKTGYKSDESFFFIGVPHVMLDTSVTGKHLVLLFGFFWTPVAAQRLERGVNTPAKLLKSPPSCLEH